MNRFLSNLPPVTKNLIIINLLIWLVMMIIPSSSDNIVMRYGGLHFWLASDFNPAQFFTYMFMHDTGSFAHVLFNMFTLFMFGILLERTMGSGRFLFFYLSCGVGAALIQELVWQMSYVDIVSGWMMRYHDVPKELAVDALRQAIADGQNIPILNSLVTIGASGAVYGVLLAFAMLFPNMPMYIMFIPVPVKAKWMVLGYGILELLIGMSGANDGVAHFAHLGGMIFGFIIIYWWKKKHVIHGGY